MDRETFTQRAYHFAAEHFQSEGYVPLSAAVLATVHPESKEQLDEPQLVLVAPDRGPDSQRDKDLFAQALRTFARDMAALMVAIIYEGWFVDLKDPRLPSDWEKRSPRDIPGHYEGVLITVETKNGNTQHVARIEESNGKRTLSEFRSLGLGDFTGRFCRMLPEHYSN